jgi:hypothetical protein
VPHQPAENNKAKSDEVAERLRRASRDPRLRGLSPAARLMRFTAIVHCVELNTGGFIPNQFPQWFQDEFASVNEDPQRLAARIIERAKADAERNRQSPPASEVN